MKIHAQVGIVFDPPLLKLPLSKDKLPLHSVSSVVIRFVIVGEVNVCGVPSRPSLLRKETMAA